MAEGIDVQKYTDWFVWARDNLGRELDPTHAAAEAAYRSATRGGSDDDAQAAARAAGSEPAALDPETMALAEWASWAISTAGFRPEQTLVVARFALADVQSNHDLDATMADVLSAAPPRPGAAEAAKPRSNRSALIAAGVVVGLLVVGGATAGVISGLSNLGGGKSDYGTPPALKPTIDAKLLPSGDAYVVATGLPPQRAVFIFVDNESHLAQTDPNGTVQATIPIPLGGHNVSVCLDQGQQACPASTFISRVQ